MADKYESVRDEIRRLLDRLGEKVLDEDLTVGDFIVAFVTQDVDSNLWFYTYDPKGDGVPEYSDQRFWFEHAAMKWLKEHRPADCAVHFGHIQVNILDIDDGYGSAFVAINRYC